ncbi:CynX/NimT family MFS transporter [Parvibaculum sp.]|uniref:MFS transporter n=1 Tax=Parvibaculum sp. TaxID=2024848 RepID=UPI00272FDD5F|nr:MFS transporter [Parvibaculum sp.]MDP1627599.1 MFS transporter [Parvibaculum sp.]MDP2148778.1 MFS transporter [Parvibaculum sp.]MDP3328698.1 MFS transporter [Parvibaculum sp.]
MNDAKETIYPWFVLLSFSFMFFLVTAGTFTSLGVVLPDMVSELGWDWTAAGLGFTILGISCGLSSYPPAFMIRRFGVRATILFGTAILVAGYLLLYFVQSVPAYFAAMLLAGTGFSFVATVPGTFMIARSFKKQSMAFGIYFTIGGVGGIVGPLIYFLAVGVWDEWRMHWMIVAVLTAIAGVITAAFLREGEDEDRRAADVATAAAVESASGVYVTKQSWTALQALRTPQFYIIAAGYVAFLLCGITVNSLSVGHLTEIGIAMGVAGGLLSFEAFLNAASRAVSGFIGEYVDPKILLIVALALLVAGMVGLGVGTNWFALMVYAIGIGVGYGMTFLATSVLLMNYYGRSAYLELFSFMNVAATLASFGPFLGGYMRDVTGSFSYAFFLYTLVPAAVLVAVLFMRPPLRAEAEEVEEEEIMTAAILTRAGDLGHVAD